MFKRFTKRPAHHYELLQWLRLAEGNYRMAALDLEYAVDTAHHLPDSLREQIALELASARTRLARLELIIEEADE